MTLQYLPKNDDALKAAMAVVKTLGKPTEQKAETKGHTYGPAKIVDGYTNPLTGKPVPTSEYVNYWVDKSTKALKLYKLSNVKQAEAQGVAPKAKREAKNGPVVVKTDPNVSDRLDGLEAAAIANAQSTKDLMDMFQQFMTTNTKQVA
jgi:hypothetical protein